MIKALKKGNISSNLFNLAIRNNGSSLPEMPSETRPSVDNGQGRKRKELSNGIGLSGENTVGLNGSGSGSNGKKTNGGKSSDLSSPSAKSKKYLQSELEPEFTDE